MKTLAYIIGVLAFFIIAALAIIGTIAPETSIYLGRQVPNKYIDEIKALGLLERNEELKYLYTDGFWDIKDGLYFVTDQKLVVYCQEWAQPETIIRFQEITSLDIAYDDSFFEDSYISLETGDGIELAFPVSSEKNRDQLFFEYLSQRSGINQEINATEAF